MKIIKKFENFEDPEFKSNPELNVNSMEDSMEDSMDKTDYTEEEDTYIGTQMLNQLSEALGTKVVNNSIDYKGKKINFYSETEKFHIGNKKFSTVDEVLEFLGVESGVLQERKRFRRR